MLKILWLFILAVKNINAINTYMIYDKKNTLASKYDINSNKKGIKYCNLLLKLIKKEKMMISKSLLVIYLINKYMHLIMLYESKEKLFDQKNLIAYQNYNVKKILIRRRIYFLKKEHRKIRRGIFELERKISWLKMKLWAYFYIKIKL
ncbi:hypothetical protein GVAV_002050 [Gurleya vavrai]